MKTEFGYAINETLMRQTSRPGLSGACHFIPLFCFMRRHKFFGSHKILIIENFFHGKEYADCGVSHEGTHLQNISHSQFRRTDACVRRHSTRNARKSSLKVKNTLVQTPRLRHLPPAPPPPPAPPTRLIYNLVQLFRGCPAAAGGGLALPSSEDLSS